MRAVLEVLEVFGVRGEARGERARIAYEDDPAGIGLEEPLMGVPAEGVRELHAVEQVAILGDEDRSADRAVHVHPQVVFARDAGDAAQGVDGAGIGAARGGDHGERDEAALAVVLDGALERVDVHGEVIVAGDGAYVLGRDADDVHALRDRAVSLLGYIGDAAAPVLGGELVVARGDERGHVRHGAAAHEDAARPFWEAGLVAEPGEQLVLGDASRGVAGVAAGMAVVARRHHVAQPGYGVDGSGDEPEEAGVVRVVAIADDVVLHLADDVFEGPSLAGNGMLRDALEGLVGRFADDGALGEMAVAREQLAHEAHGCELDILFLG